MTEPQYDADDMQAALEAMGGNQIFFCEHCEDATDGKVVRGCGVTFWECTKCGRILDEDFDDQYADEDGEA